MILACVLLLFGVMRPVLGMGMFAASVVALAVSAFGQAAAEAPARLTRDAPIVMEIGPGGTREAMIRLRSGESADIVVLQDGVDVVVELFGPAGNLLDSVDSPNGRQGPEPVSIMARDGGDYRLRIRPIAPNEPRGRISVNIAELRSAAATRRLLDSRRRVRADAAAWVRPQSASMAGPDEALPPFDRLAAEARIVGLGEATHGSRELNDLRLALVQRLVQRHDYRLIALEDSASRWRSVAHYVDGTAPDSGTASLEWGWIGRRARRQLLDWVRQWNLEHPQDRVRIVGVDPQDNAPDRARLGAFLGRAYGEPVLARWNAQVAELAAADEQTAVFGDSGTSQALRQFLQEVVAQLTADAPLLRARFGTDEYAAAHEAALDLAAFVDFNTGDGAVTHSRDWYMALGIIRAMEQSPSPPKTIYWGHNAHVSAAATRWGPTGALLRQAYGCAYRAVATTFGQGAFIAQIPNDPTDRLAANVLPGPVEEENVETLLASVRPGTHFSAWRCGEPDEARPQWLRAERPMRWVGGLYAPDSPPTASFRPYRLTTAFDAIVFVPSVTAEEIPADRPVVPPRRRDPAPASR